MSIGVRIQRQGSCRSSSTGPSTPAPPPLLLPSHQPAQTAPDLQRTRRHTWRLVIKDRLDDFKKWVSPCVRSYVDITHKIRFRPEDSPPTPSFSFYIRSLHILPSSPRIGYPPRPFPILALAGLSAGKFLITRLSIVNLSTCKSISRLAVSIQLTFSHKTMIRCRKYSIKRESRLRRPTSLPPSCQTRYIACFGRREPSLSYFKAS